MQVQQKEVRRRIGGGVLEMGFALQKIQELLAVADEIHGPRELCFAEGVLENEDVIFVIFRDQDPQGCRHNVLVLVGRPVEA